MKVSPGPTNRRFAMDGVKRAALVVLFWGIVGTSANADPMVSNGDGWSFWLSGASVNPTQAPAPEPATPPASVQTTMAAVPANPTPSGGTADAYLNFGNGPYPEASLLTSGSAQPWYNSPVVQKFYGGQAPNPQQQADFANTV